MDPGPIWFCKLFVEGVSAGGFQNGDFIGMSIIWFYISGFVSFFAGAYMQGCVSKRGAITDLYSV